MEEVEEAEWAEGAEGVDEERRGRRDGAANTSIVLNKEILSTKECRTGVRRDSTQ